MVTGNEDLLGALSEAYAMEKGLKAFYTYAVDRVGSDRAKEVLARLRDWEDKHMEYVAYLHGSITGELTVNTFDEFATKMPDSHIEGGITQQDAALLYDPAELNDDHDAVKIGLRIEGRAYTYYRQWSEKAADSNARIIFSDMMEQEQRHVDLLKKLQQELG